MESNGSFFISGKRTRKLILFVINNIPKPLIYFANERWTNDPYEHNWCQMILVNYSLVVPQVTYKTAKKASDLTDDSNYSQQSSETEQLI